jgi:hypothetical protein
MASKSKREGALSPPYRFAPSIAALLRMYEHDLVGKYVSDPLGTRVWFMDYNFPKLIQLQFRGTKARAQKALEHLRNESANESEYSCDKNRAGTIFWIPEIISDPDSIHENAHPRIMGEEVYVKRYAKAGACYKLVFTEVDSSINQRIVTTSFMAPEDRLEVFIKKPGKWVKKAVQTPPQQEKVLGIIGGQMTLIEVVDQKLSEKKPKEPR